MNRTIIKLFLCLCIVTALPSYAYNTVHYYFKLLYNVLLYILFFIQHI